MIKKRKNHSKVFDMVKEDLFAIGKVKDVSLSIKKFNKVYDPKPKDYKAQ